MTRAQGLVERENVTPTAILVELELSEAKLVEAFRRLSSGRQSDLLDKLQELCEPILRTAPVSRLYGLTGIVSLGGDALADTEGLYDGNGSH